MTFLLLSTSPSLIHPCVLLQPCVPPSHICFLKASFSFPSRQHGHERHRPQSIFPVPAGAWSERAGAAVLTVAVRASSWRPSPCCPCLCPGLPVRHWSGWKPHTASSEKRGGGAGGLAHLPCHQHAAGLPGRWAAAPAAGGPLWGRGPEPVRTWRRWYLSAAVPGGAGASPWRHIQARSE